MFKRDANVKIDGRDGWGIFLGHYSFQCGKFIYKKQLDSPSGYSKLVSQSDIDPVMIAQIENTRRRWWFFRGEVYFEDEGYTETEVKVLALERLSKKEKHIKRAMSLVEQATSAKSDSRETIPDEVKIFVWKRDAGKCIKCDSKERLEFDHVIPIVKGGSNTARNLQLLCETCNRNKGGDLI